MVADEHDQLRAAVREVRDEVRELRELVTHQGVEPERRRLDVQRVSAELQLLRQHVERHGATLYGRDGLEQRTASLERAGAVQRGQLSQLQRR